MTSWVSTWAAGLVDDEDQEPVQEPIRPQAIPAKVWLTQQAAALRSTLTLRRLRLRRRALRRAAWALACLLLGMLRTPVSLAFWVGMVVLAALAIADLLEANLARILARESVYDLGTCKTIG